MKTHFVLLMVLMAGSARAEEWMCKRDGGCEASIHVGDGTIHIETFRKGDILGTEDGWIIHPKDGWEKLRPPLPVDMALIGRIRGYDMVSQRD